MFKVTLDVYDIKTGLFYKVIPATNIRVESTTNPRDIFIKITNENGIDVKNKYFIMKEEYENGFKQYIIRTDREDAITEFNKISPNNIDKDMIIDAILGCEIPKELVNKTNNAFAKCICISTESGQLKCSWTANARIRLQKFDILRLKELYDKLKS